MSQEPNSFIGSFITEIWLGFAGVVIAALTWVVRTVLTNQRQVELLRAEAASRHEADTETRRELHQDIRELRSAIADLGRRIGATKS